MQGGFHEPRGLNGGILNRLAGAGVLGFLWFGSQGCGQVVGEYDVAPDVDAGATRPRYAEGSCATCVADHCAELEAECLEDIECRALDSCVAGCARSDPSCRGKCLVEQSLGRDAFERLSACRHGSCVEECIGRGGYYDFLGSDCSQCIARACADEIKACASEVDCDWAVACISQLPSAEGVLECSYDLTGGISEALDLVEDCPSRCPAECQSGRDWDCVGQFEYQQPSSSTDIPYEIHVTRLDEAPAVGVQVQACPGAPLPCSDWVPVDATNTASLLLPNPKFGFQGYLRLEGSVDGVEVFPLRFYFGRPIVRWENQLGVRVLTREQALPATAMHGHVVPFAWDCLWQPTVNVRYEVDAKDASTSQLETLGVSLFLNVPEGNTVVRAFDVATGNEVAATTVDVEADHITAVYLHPKPGGGT